jgi:hypothetical protein
VTVPCSCLATISNRTGTEAPTRSCKNQIFWFGKLDGPILSGPTAVRDAVGLRLKAPPSAKRRMDSGEARTTITLEVGAAVKRSNRRKMRKKEN